jgi:branched-chain amino acid transport system permease protein
MGLSLIFGVLKVVNVGHGAFVMVGAYTALVLFRDFGVIPLYAVPAAFVIGMALGFIFYHIVIKRLLAAPELATLLATFAIGILLEELVKQKYGADSYGYNWVSGKLDVGFTVFPYTKLYAASGGVLVALALYLWYHRTRAGAAMRSVVEDSEGARVCGINVDRVYALSFSLGIGLTVMSGVLLTMFNPVGIHPYMGGSYTLKAFVIAVLGGLASPYGAFFAGLIFGLLDNGTYSILSSVKQWGVEKAGQGMESGLYAFLADIEPFSLTRSLSFVALLVILLIRPTGLFKSQ